jgi:hypothetical protein
VIEKKHRKLISTKARRLKRKIEENHLGMNNPLKRERTQRIAIIVGTTKSVTETRLEILENKMLLLMTRNSENLKKNTTLFTKTSQWLSLKM